MTLATNIASKKRKMNSENQRGRKEYLSKRKIRQVGAELLMRMWADKKEETYLGAMSIPISLVRSKSTVDRVNIKIAYRPKTIR